MKNFLSEIWHCNIIFTTPEENVFIGIYCDDCICKILFKTRHKRIVKKLSKSLKIPIAWGGIANSIKKYPVEAAVFDPYWRRINFLVKRHNEIFEDDIDSYDQCKQLEDLMNQEESKFWNNRFEQLRFPSKNENKKISILKMIILFKRELKKIAKEKNLKFYVFSFGKEYHFIIENSIEEIIMGLKIKINTGKITVITKYMIPAYFERAEWQDALYFVKNFFATDTTPLEKTKTELRERYFVSQKNCEIAETSIELLFKSILGKEICCNPDKTIKAFHNRIPKTRIKTEVFIDSRANQSTELVYKIVIYYKAFLENPSLLTDLLKNLRRISIEDKISCEIYSYNFTNSHKMRMSSCKI